MLVLMRPSPYGEKAPLLSLKPSLTVVVDFGIDEDVARDVAPGDRLVHEDPLGSGELGLPLGIGFLQFVRHLRSPSLDCINSLMQ